MWVGGRFPFDPRLVGIGYIVNIDIILLHILVYIILSQVIRTVFPSYAWNFRFKGTVIGSGDYVCVPWNSLPIQKNK